MAERDLLWAAVILYAPTCTFAALPALKRASSQAIGRALLSSPTLPIGEGPGVGAALWLPSPRRRGVGGEVPTRTAARSARGSPPRPAACAASCPRRLAAPGSRTARSPAGLRPQGCRAPA